MMFCSCVYIISSISTTVNCSHGLSRRTTEGEFIMHSLELETILLTAPSRNVASQVLSILKGTKDRSLDTRRCLYARSGRSRHFAIVVFVDKAHKIQQSTGITVLII